MRFTTKDPPPGSQSNLASPTCGGSSHCATTSNPTCTQGAANSNLYAYAADNPLTNTDPTGLDLCWDCHASAFLLCFFQCGAGLIFPFSEICEVICTFIFLFVCEYKVCGAH